MVFGGIEKRLFNKIDGDLLEAQGEIQVYDRVRFEDVRETEIRKLFASPIWLSNWFFRESHEAKRIPPGLTRFRRDRDSTRHNESRSPF